MYFDHFEIDVLSFKIRDSKNSFNRDFSEFSFNTADNLWAKGGHCCINQVLVIICHDIQVVTDFFESFERNIASFFVSISDFKRMEAFIDKNKGVFQQGASEDNNTGCTITDFVILGFRKLNQKLRNRMFDFHLFHDSSTVICNQNVLITTNEHFIHTFRAKWGFHGVWNNSCSAEVCLGIIQLEFMPAET